MIQIDHLTKVYASGKGIFDVSLKVKKGEVFGFLGPNGAGKTTTIRQLLGFTNATKGTCMINGLDTRLETKDVLKSVGYLPGEIAFFDNMTGDEFLTFMGRLHHMMDGTKKEALIQRFELDTSGKIRKMSKGTKQKLAIVAAFMHNPDVLILDEPTSGLDPLMQKHFIDLVLEEKALGKTIFMSSHIFEEVERTCERVAIIKDGKIVAVNTIADLKNQMQKTIHVTLGHMKDITKLKDSGFEVKVIGESVVSILFSSNKLTKLIRVLSQMEVKDMETHRQSLEDIFIHFYAKEGK